MPWPGLEPGCLAALPPQTGGNGLASSAIMVNAAYSGASVAEGRSPTTFATDEGKIPGAKKGAGPVHSEAVALDLAATLEPEQQLKRLV